MEDKPEYTIGPRQKSQPGTRPAGEAAAKDKPKKEDVKDVAPKKA